MTASPRLQPSERRAQIVDAVLDLTAERGLDAVTVREVAAAVGVSIGTVQHHFRAKDEMVVAAFEAVVDATRQRLAAVRFGADAAATLERTLSELLPLDSVREREARIYLAFAARSANSPDLQRIQSALQAEIRAGIAGVLGRGGAADAAVLAAVVDGLVLEAVSGPEAMSTRRIREVLRRAITRCVG